MKFALVIFNNIHSCSAFFLRNMFNHTCTCCELSMNFRLSIRRKSTRRALLQSRR
uniref:Uncharacterized protein n=1 Tax=Parascaris equorum TaxID=6256 RepID=A0A914R6I7_PAREQ